MPSDKEQAIAMESSMGEGRNEDSSIEEQSLPQEEELSLVPEEKTPEQIAQEEDAEKAEPEPEEQEVDQPVVAEGVKPTKETLQYKHVKFLEKETQRLREELAKHQGIIEGKASLEKQPVEAPVAKSLPQVQIGQNTAEVIKQLDDMWTSGQFEGSYEDYTTARSAIVVQDIVTRTQAQAQTVATVQNDINRLNKAVESRSEALPGVKDAVYKIQQDPIAGNDPYIKIAVMENLDKGGIDLVHYLGNHPKYLAAVLALNPVDKSYELTRMRKQLLGNVKPVVKKSGQPMVRIQNSIISKSNDTPDVDSEMADEIISAVKRSR